MKDAEVMKTKLKEVLKYRIYIEYFNQVPDSVEILPEIRKLLIEGIETILIKIISQLDSKSVSKSTIITSLNRAIFKLQTKGIKYEGMICLSKVIERIFEESKPDFFKQRLNVKSKEFIELPDWDPNQEK